MAIFKTFQLSNADALLVIKSVEKQLLAEQTKKGFTPKNFPEHITRLEKLRALFNELCQQHSKQVEI